MANHRSFTGNFRSYFRIFPRILEFQLIQLAVTALILWGVRKISMLLIYSTGRVAVTSGDFRFLFFRWQGWVMMLLILASLFLVIAFFINGILLLSHSLIFKEKIGMPRLLVKAVRCIRRFFRPGGFGICIAMAVTVPAALIALNLPQTTLFQLPNLATSKVMDETLYHVLFVIFTAGLLLWWVRNVFMIPWVILEDRPAREAKLLAHEMIRKHWKNFLLNILLFIIEILGLLGLFYGLLSAIPEITRPILRFGFLGNRILTVTICYVLITAMALLTLMLIPAQFMELTRLFYSYKEEREIHPVLRPPKSRLRNPELWMGAGIAAALITAIVVSVVWFDVLMPAGGDVPLIAHRLGGFEAVENSMTGLRISINQQVYGYETDIQRSKDGVYFINHDRSFKRIYGDKRTASQMTWDEIKQLEARNPDGSIEHPVTLEEVLDEARGNGILFIELKAPTADEKMCDDVVAMIRERGMEEECAIISLQYRLISYIYRNYEEIDTGYLYFYSYGNTPALDCDMLIMEEDAATRSAVETIHTAGKKAIVWTVNSVSSARRFLDSDIDAIITDRVELCRRVQGSLKMRNDYSRIMDAFGLTRLRNLLSGNSQS